MRKYVVGTEGGEERPPKAVRGGRVEMGRSIDGRYRGGNRGRGGYRGIAVSGKIPDGGIISERSIE